MKSREIMEILYEAVYQCISNVILPVGSTLVPSLGIVLILLVITVSCHLLGVYTFLDYRGVILATAILCIQCYFERRSNNDLLRLYNSAKSRIEEIERWEKGPSTDDGTSGSSAGSTASDEEDRDRTGNGIQDSM